MIKSNVNEILSNVSKLSLEDQDFIRQALSRRIQEIRRTQIAERAKDAEQNYRKGYTTTGDIDDLMEQADND